MKKIKVNSTIIILTIALSLIALAIYGILSSTIEMESEYINAEFEDHGLNIYNGTILFHKVTLGDFKYNIIIPTEMLEINVNSLEPNISLNIYFSYEGRVEKKDGILLSPEAISKVELTLDSQEEKQRWKKSIEQLLIMREILINGFFSIPFDDSSLLKSVKRRTFKMVI